MLSSITTLRGTLKGKRVLVRSDFNVPIVDGAVRDDFRIVKSLPTLQFLHREGAKVVVISHNEGEEKTLRPVFEYLQNKIEISFASSVDAPEVAGIGEGAIVLCENLRLHDGEKSNDPAFAKKLASLADIYVNDAFAVSHRSHASVVGVPMFLPSYTGFLFEEEVKNLEESLNPQHPFLFILGGAKFDTKLPLIKKFLTIDDKIFVGGALSNNIFKAKGYEVGNSLVAPGEFHLEDIIASDTLLLPLDVNVGEPDSTEIRSFNSIGVEEVVYDIGPQSLELLHSAIEEAHYILWNGPMGNYEKGYKGATLELARAIAESGAKSVVGGGDTLAAIAELNLYDKFSFVSTGGGAMLDFLLNGTLPGIEALKTRS
jgi:phosphoglycerate kinase